MLAKAVLAYALTLPILLLLAAGAAEDVPRYWLRLTLTADVSGLVQVFCDAGRGFNEQESVVGTLRPTAEPRTLEWDLPARRYTGFRVDFPAGAGRYTLYRLAIVGEGGRDVADVPLSPVTELVQVNLVEGRVDRLDVAAPADAADPHVGYGLAEFVDLLPPGFAGSVARRYLPIWGAAWLALMAIGGLASRVAAPRVPGALVAWAHRAPPAALVAAAALAATLVSAYPVLLLGRSFVSPNNGMAHVHDVFISASVPLLLMVCAVGASALSDRRQRTLLVGALCAVAAWRLLIRVRFLASPAGFEVYAAWAVLSACVLLALLVPRIRAGDTTARFAGGLLLACVLLPGGIHVETGRPAIDHLLVQPRPRAPLDQRSPAIDAAASLEPARVAGLGWTLFPGTSGLYGLEGYAGADALRLPRYEALLDSAGVWRGWTWVTRITGTDDAVRLAPVLDLLGVSLLLNGGEPTPGTERGALPGSDRVRLERRPTAWPRAFFVDRVATYAGPSELLELVRRSSGPIAAVEADDRRALDAIRSLEGGATAPVPATAYSLSTNSTRFRVAAPHAGVVVLTETFLPDDFQVSLNGAAVEYFRVNHAFKGVRIPHGGHWEVTFDYRPADWNVLIWLGAGALAALGALLLSTRP
ncbi:MAG: hypothetical protein H0X67_01480 [Acidobacteria bacterium]|nr:hypothetical protein [Acidobacteriota bacterium]